MDINFLRENALCQLERAKRSGYFICFEGCSGSGKTKHIELMYKFLSAQFGSRVKFNPEPTQFAIGKIIREFIEGRASSIPDDLIEDVKKEFALFKKMRGHIIDIEITELLFSLFFKISNKKFSDLFDKEIQLMYILDRFFDIYGNIVPHMDTEGIVVQDRYVLSTVCYGSKTKKDRDFYIRTHNIILEDTYIKPHITFILSAPPEICLKRLVEAGKILDRFENLEKLSIIHTQYKEIFEEEKNKGYVFLVDSSGNVEETKGSIISIFQKQCLPHKFFAS